MFFIDDDQPETSQGREDRRPRAHHHVHFATADAMPLVVALTVRQSAVLDGHAAAEGLSEQPGDRWRQRDLRHEQQHGTTRLQAGARQAQVDLRLAAAGHALQQRHLKRRGAEHRQECVEHLALLVRECEEQRRSVHGGTGASVVAHDPARERVALDGAPLDVREAHPDQPANGVAADATLPEVGRVDAVRRIAQQRTGLRLAAPELGRLGAECRGRQAHPAPSP